MSGRKKYGTCSHIETHYTIKQTHKLPLVRELKIIPIEQQYVLFTVNGEKLP